MKNSRAYAAIIINKVLTHKVNLDEALAQHFTQNEQDRSFIQELCYGTLRFYPSLNVIVSQLLKKPFAQKDRDIHILALLGAYQLLYLNTAEHAAIAETVEASRQLNKTWATKVLNAILRNLQRQREKLLAQAETHEVIRTAHPKWLVKELKQAYPHEWESICAANNVKPPMTLRVNLKKISREDYLQKLKHVNIEAHPAPLSHAGIYLSQPAPVNELPDFSNGEVSVQDEAAQLAAHLLNLLPNHTVLDACAAPGGKTCHMLETEPTIKLLAVEADSKRTEKIRDNFQRLKLSAEIIVADASKIAAWWNGQLFDRILLDAPCSATGVIRRHPDIKVLRKSEDIINIQKVQADLLNALWPLLKPNGLFLYATCSILPQENSQQIKKFLTAHSNAELQTISHPGKIIQTPDWQLLPKINGHDGFYYALLHRKG